MDYRIESDTMGEVRIPIHALWGPQTERSRQNFKIGQAASMPIEVIHAFAIVKKAAAETNASLGVLSEEKANLIAHVCSEIIERKWDDQFPLVIWQTGSGTQTNMNLNEVISNRAHQIQGRKLIDSKRFILPNDDVNKSQSSNDTFPTAMHIAVYIKLVENTLPQLQKLKKVFHQKSIDFNSIVKTGRTHLMDATPITLGQVFSGYEAQIGYAILTIEHALAPLSELAIGATAVGTGLNTPKGYAEKVAKRIAELTNYPFVSAPNKFQALAAHDALVYVSSGLKQAAVTLHKIANDLRMLSSGPRCGIGEIEIPDNEPGSSIMPGKVNPTQIEALTMVCAQILGNDVTVAFASSQGQFELNVYKPVIVSNVLESAQLLGDCCESFRENCIIGIQPNHARIAFHLQQSLMLVAALNPKIGYQKSAEIATFAHKQKITLKEATLFFGYLTAEAFDELVDPKKMT